jgi:hypothetical protein
VERAAAAIRSLSSLPNVLAQHGLSTAEFSSALPAAIESVRGSMSASNADRREFVVGVLDYLVSEGAVASVECPSYGDDTVYRLNIQSIGAVAIIQKGCPDGAHSSVNWSVPPWADEAYLWWLCPSLTRHPGEHIVKGINRLRQQFFSERSDTLSGVIFHNELCGTALRPCPKSSRAAEIRGQTVPAPCIYTMPERRTGETSWNWRGERALKFPGLMLQAFGVSQVETDSFTGFVGFKSRDNGELRSTVSARYGPGRISTYRS